MGIFVVGAALVLAAVGTLAFAVLGDASPRVPQGRRRAPSAAPSAPLAKVAFGAVSGHVDTLIKGRSWAPVTAQELDEADVDTPISVLVTWSGIAASVAGLVGTFLLGSPFLGLLLFLITPFGFKMWLRLKASRRRKAFAGQLDQTLRIIASALRAGQSLATAMGSVAGDIEAPMGQELGRVVNENRVGRDLVEALLETADRMQSEDLRWFAEAVAVQRDTGGNLNDIIDVVAATIRDRAEIREKINAYASEGKASAWVLMGLPVALAATYTLMSPGYLDPLVSSLIGVLLLALSGVLYVVAFFWMRAIIDIKV